MQLSIDNRQFKFGNTIQNMYNEPLQEKLYSYIQLSLKNLIRYLPMIVSKSWLGTAE